MEVNMNTKDQNTRTLEERLGDTIQPLIPYMARRLYGPASGRLFAHIYGERPTPRMVRAWQKLQDICQIRSFLVFLSPTYRRRFRNKIKIQLKLYYEENNLPRLCRKTMLESWEALKKVIKESEPDLPLAGDLDKELEAVDLSRIPKYSDMEFKAMERAERIGNNEEEVLKLFSASSTVDPRLEARLLAAVGQDDYACTACNVFAELQLEPLSLAGKLTHRQGFSLLSKITGLPTKELKVMQPAEACEAAVKIITWEFELAIDMERALEFLRGTIGKLMVNQFLDQPYSKVKKVSLDEAVGDDLTLKDTIPCDQAAEQLSLIEKLIFLRQYLPQHLPPSEWEASDLFLRADEMEITPEELCEQENENYKTIQRNFERAIKRLKSQSTKP